MDTPWIKRVCGGHVLVSDTDTIPILTIILNYVIFSNYYLWRRVSIRVSIRVVSVLLILVGYFNQIIIDVDVSVSVSCPSLLICHFVCLIYFFNV
jgi:hypothetical protein